MRFADGATAKLRIAQVLPDDPARGDFVLLRRLVRAHDPAALDDYAIDSKLTDGLATMLIVIAVGYSGIAVANSMAMTAHGRRRNFAVLRPAGGTVRQLLPFSVAETSLVVAVEVALGVLVPLGPLAAMVSGLSRATSTDVGLHLDLSTIAAVALGSLVLAIASTVTVTWRTVRSKAAQDGGEPRARS
ncbi:ABC transporter permease [Streptomyces laculatispora]|uniref:ABC transporter permease n=1 Tax=Streptomyces laculatispora TaxID=887464 RepID=A0ABY9IBQ1_9ACTN|nr:ABC transporter permease [Streptomyces laculatispora]WLQ44302.1 ABC transporter permease [Streptomyces laculatispora]